jgi:hypothetical protein
MDPLLLAQVAPGTTVTRLRAGAYAAPTAAVLLSKIVSSPTVVSKADGEALVPMATPQLLTVEKAVKVG